MPYGITQCYLPPGRGNRIYWLRLTAVLAQIYSFISTGFYACRRFYHIPSSILDESAITDRICLLAMCCNFCCVIKSSCVVYCICQSSLVGLRKQLAKMNSSLHTTHSVRSLGFMFDEHLTFADQVSSLSKSSFYRIRKFAVMPLPRFQNSHHHCHLNRYLQT